MKWRFGRALLFLGVFCSVGSGSWAASASRHCGQFQFATTLDGVIGNREAALLRILSEDGDPLGTGFLLDAERGYILTARHVVVDNVHNTPIPSMAASRARPGKTMRLQFVDEAEAQDVALMKFVDPKWLSDIPAFDLGLEFARNELAAIYGYQFGESIPTIAKGTIAIDDGGRVQMRATTLPGDSGSPVLNQQGLVIGIVLEHRMTQVATISATLDLLDLLLSHASSSSSERAYRGILDGRQDAQFIQEFDPKIPPEDLTNLSLLGVLAMLSRHDSLPSQSQQSLDCPLYFAATHRNLGYAARLIAHLMPEFELTDFARDELRRGEALEGLRRNEEARRSYALALESFDRSVSVTLRENSEPLPSALCDLVLDESGTNLSDYFEQIGMMAVSSTLRTRPVECADDGGEPALANKFRDYALAQLKLSGLSELGARDQTLQKVQRSAALAALLSNSGEPFGANVALIGDAAAVAGDYSLALSAFATAWDSGAKQPWVLNNFAYAAVRSGSNPDLVPGDPASMTRALDAATMKAIGRDQLLAISRGVEWQ